MADTIPSSILKVVQLVVGVISLLHFGTHLARDTKWNMKTKPNFAYFEKLTIGNSLSCITVSTMMFSPEKIRNIKDAKDCLLTSVSSYLIAEIIKTELAVWQFLVSLEGVIEKKRSKMQQ